MLDARREKFAQQVASGYPATVAFQEAGYSKGYSPNALRVQAHRLRHHHKVNQRIGELMEETAKESKFTRQWLLKELESAAKDAKENKHSGARVSALAVISRIIGEDKTTITDGRLDHMALRPELPNIKQFDPIAVIEAARSDPAVAAAITEAGKILDTAGDTEAGKLLTKIKAGRIIEDVMQKNGADSSNGKS